MSSETLERALWNVAEEDIAPDQTSNLVRPSSDENALMKPQASDTKSIEITGTAGKAAEAVPAYEDLVKSQPAPEALSDVSARDIEAMTLTAHDTRLTEAIESEDRVNTAVLTEEEQIGQAANAVHLHAEEVQSQQMGHENTKQIEQAEPIRVQHIQAGSGKVQLAEIHQIEAQAEQPVAARPSQPIYSTPERIRVTSFERAAMEPTFTGMRLSGMKTSGRTFNEPIITHAAAVDANSTEQLKSVETGTKDRSAETLALGMTTTEYLGSGDRTRQSSAVIGGLQHLETDSSHTVSEGQAFYPSQQVFDSYDGSQSQQPFSTPGSSSRNAATEMTSAQRTGIEASSNSSTPAPPGPDVHGTDETISAQLARTRSLRRKASFESITSTTSNSSTAHTHSIVSQGISTPNRSTSLRLSGAALDESSRMQTTTPLAAASTPTRSSTATPDHTPTHSPHTHANRPYSQASSHTHFRSLASVPSKESIVTERTFSGASFRVPSFTNPHFAETHFTHHTSDTPPVYGQNSFRGVVQEGPAPRTPPRPQ